jgi:prepilin-type N-terminal cleavage/methylation domain-containing protein
MKLNQVQGASRKKNTSAFTLIEMIGVLAVIAILAALLIPKVFNAINSARINNTAVSIDTMKTAVTDHYGKYGSFNLLNGTGTPLTPPVTNYDSILLQEGLLDQPFAVKIGAGSTVQLVTGSNANNTTGYKLDGVTNLTVNMAFVCEVVISNVLPQDALDLNALIDGSNTNLGAGNLTSPDAGGRVEYTLNGGLATVYVFLTGR